MAELQTRHIRLWECRILARSRCSDCCWPILILCSCFAHSSYLMMCRQCCAKITNVCIAYLSVVCSKNIFLYAANWLLQKFCHFLAFTERLLDCLLCFFCLPRLQNWQRKRWTIREVSSKPGWSLPGKGGEKGLPVVNSDLHVKTSGCKLGVWCSGRGTMRVMVFSYFHSSICCTFLPIQLSYQRQHVFHCPCQIYLPIYRTLSNYLLFFWSFLSFPFLRVCASTPAVLLAGAPGRWAGLGHPHLSALSSTSINYISIIYQLSVNYLHLSTVIPNLHSYLIQSNGDHELK